MVKRKVTSKYQVRSGRKHHGFTMVELIVVLAILAIVATVAIISIVGYIEKSRYEQNTQNAIAVYQAAQTAISHKSSNGTLDSWAKELDGNRLDTSELNEVNDSIHSAFYYTYNPGDEDNPLFELLSTYFYDQSLFNGTITVVFDVSATHDSLGKNVYSASVIGAFYSGQNPKSSNKNSAGWDTSYIDVNKGNGNVAPWNELPCTDPSFRRSNSYVGYFDGTEGSIYVPGQIIGPVVLPITSSFEMEGHIIGPTVDGTEPKGYLFNLRNGETLDVSWAIFDEDYTLDAGYYNGDVTEHANHNENIYILLKNRNDEYRVDINGNVIIDPDDIRLTISSTNLKNVTWSASSQESFEDVDNFSIKRESWTGFINVTVKHGEKNLGTYSFPITKSLVIGDGRTGCPNPKYGYYEYSLALDCMMVRSDETDNNNLSSRYRISRLFEESLYSSDNKLNQTPNNIYAVLLSETNWENYSAPNTLNKQNSISATYAARAMNDPVYCTGTTGKADGIHYKYHVAEGAAQFDDPDKDSGDENKYVITGRCIVNALFGDVNYSKSIGGTSFTIQDNKVKTVDAVITSYRHLYNIRGISSDAVANYRIVRDLDWYVHESVNVVDADEDKTYNYNYYASEVKVFAKNNAGFNSPVANDGSLKVVSFPALKELNNGSTLTALSKKNGNAYSINNVQMRLASFRLGTDAGYGLVCKNSGTIVDIHTNNLNLVLANCADGGNDYDSIFVNSISVTKQLDDNNGTGDLANTNNDKPIGGLVGLNTDTGVIGQESGSIVMSNSVVMGNHYWNIYSKVNKICTGGVIGKNESSLLGSIEINGAFAVVGRDNVGGIIGHSTADIGAQLLVNYTEAPDAMFTLPSYNNTDIGGNHMSSVIISKNCAGAAIGQLQGAALTASSDPFTYSSTPENGVFSNVNYDNFQVDVTLNTDSLIYMLGTYNAEKESEKVAVGGAIGFMNTTDGTSASIRVRNSGNIIVNDTSSDIYCGGVIGRDYDCSTTNMYIDFENNTGRIGYFTNSTGPLATGGAYGHIQCSRTGRTIAINGVNGGTLVSRGSGNVFKGTPQAQGTGGAVGGVSRIGDNGVSIVFKINVENKASSKIIGNGENNDYANGTGGAIGAIGNKDADERSTIPTGSVIYADNKGTITGKHHVGGTVGDSVANYGQFYAVNKGSIKGIDYVGGAVGRSAYSNYSTIQSVLYGSNKIEGNSYVGGSVGKLFSQYDNALVRTIVRGNSTISGSNTGSYVGGVCGQVVMTGSSINGIVELEGDGSAPTLEVNGSGSQIGGVAGQLFANNADNNAVVRTPSQNPGNRLVLNVSGVDNVGGIIGKLNDDDKSTNINVDLSIAFLPGSSVEGTGKNVGGAVGFLVTKEGKNNYAGKIYVSSVADTTTAGECHINGQYYVGGAVGQFYCCTSNSNELDEIRVDFRYLNCNVSATGKNDSGNSCAGGAIGYIGCNTDTSTGSTQDALPIIVMLGNSSVVAASSGTGSTTYGNCVGGAIGYNAAKVGTITMSSAGTIQGNDYVGGAIGYNVENTNCTVGDISVEITNGKMIGNSRVGGAIGRNSAVSIGEITATVIGNVAGNGDYVGGVIGYNNSSLTKDIVGKITGSVSGAGNIGGIIGYNDAAISAALKGTISGTVKGTSDNVAGGIGHTVNKTVSGDVSVVFTVNSNIQENKVQGVNNVGGIIGFNDGTEFSSNDGISSNIPSGFSITGSGYVGGAVGRNSGILKTVQSVVNGNVIGTSITGDVGGAIGQNNQAITSVTTTLGSDANVKSSGNYVGGAIGDNKAKVTTVTVTSSGDVEGAGKVGGAIGQNTGTLDSVSVTLEGKVCGTGSDGEVGGTIGYNEAVINSKIDISLKGEVFAGIRGDDGSLSDSYDNVGGAIGHSKANSCAGDITVTFSGNAKVEGGNNIGGIIGFDEGTNISSKMELLIPVKCLVKGYGTEGCVGGVIGKLTGNCNGKLYSVISNINGEVISLGGSVGGAIGYVYYSNCDNANKFSVENVSVTLTGLVKGDGEDVGGAIGYLKSEKKYVSFKSITTELQGNAIIQGEDHVGGTLGYTECNIDTVVSEITGSSQVIGVDYVGGAIGLARAHVKVTGDEVFNLSKDESSGRIGLVKANISADYALTGTTCVGGAVGQSGDKPDKDNYYSTALLDVQCEINARYLFNPTQTGAEDPAEMSCVGGVIGRLAEGRVESITLGGSGGACNISKGMFGEEYPYEGPNVSYANTVLIAARGQSVGGIIGQVGINESINSVSAQNVTISKVTISEDGPMLCVVSVNGADRIGGWIGCGLGASGGFGNRNETDYNNADKRAIFNVDNVRLVYSEGNYVGGFCGYSRRYYNSKIPATFADVNVTLTDANVIGKTGVGGAFGYAYYMYFKKGIINVNLSGRTNIGDISGNAMPGDNNTYSSICYEAGGAVGRIDTSKEAFNVPIKVTFSGSLSRVWAGGGSGLQSDYGVGGIVGSLVKFEAGFNADARFIIAPSESDSLTSDFLVYSKNSNAGGAFGYISNSQMTNYTSAKDCYADKLTVQIESSGAAAGGFVGKIANMKGKTLKFCHFDGTVIAGNNSYAGGFVGYLDNMGTGIIDSCYTTAIVNSTGSATGGFAGCVNSGTIQNCYVGGHTYQGQYVSGEGNITGAGSVGGFVGNTTKENTFNNCYTTASVYGSESKVGGFVGNRSDKSTIKYCYCSGAVTGSGSVGSFAGQSNLANYVKSYVLDGINDADMPLIGSGTMVGNNDTLNLADKDYINRIDTATGGNFDKTQSFNASPFDSSLGNKYPLRAVINKKHVGDWGIPFDGENVYSIANAEIELINSVGYRKGGVTLGENEISVIVNGTPLNYGVDYTLSYKNNNAVGEATVIIAGVPSKGYAGVVTRTFTINKVNIQNASVVISGKQYDDQSNPLYDYTGSAIVPTTEVTINGDTLVINKDYYLTYDNDSFEGDNDNNHTDLGTVTVTVNGIGNYEGIADLKGKFVIQGMDIGKAVITLTGNTAAELIYDGNAKEPGVIVRIGGQSRIKDVDYTVAYENNINAGTATITITGQGILRGSTTRTFVITTAENSWVVTPSINGWTWSWDDDSNAQLPTGTARFGEVEFKYFTDVSCTTPTDLANSGAVTSGGQPVKAGTYYLKAYVERYDSEDANGNVGYWVDNNNVKHYNYNYLERIIAFTIMPFNISSVSEVTIDPNVYCVTGSAIEPDPSNVNVIAYSGEDDHTLVYNDDYSIRYINNLNVGEANAIVEGKGNYTGTCRGTFTIRQPIVTFDSCGGSEIDPSELSIVYGQTVSRPEDPVRDSGTDEYSWRFDGWYANEEYEGGTYNFSSAVTGDVTLYAKWVKQYTVTFCITTDENADNPPSTKTVLVDAGSCVEAPSVPVWEGLTFAGWYKNDPLSPVDPDTDPSEIGLYDFNTHVDENMILYAKWQAKVSFVIVGKKTDEQNPDNLIVDYNSSAEIAENELYSTTEIRARDSETGKWIYDGWYLDEDLKKPFDPSDVLTGDITLYTKWTKVHEVTFIISDSESYSVPVYIGSTVPVPTVPVSEVYEDDLYDFDDWYKDAACTSTVDFTASIYADVTYYAKWTEKEFALSFDSNGGTGTMDAITVTSVTGVSIPANSFSKENCTFLGWSTDPNATEAMYDDEALITLSEDTKVYAVWKSDSGG